MTCERLWTVDFTKIVLANFMLFFSFYLLTPLLPIYLSETFGAGKHEIGAILSCYSVTALLSRPFAGYIVDSFNRKMVLVLVYSLFFLFFSGYLVAGTLMAFAVVRTLHGAPFGMSTVANSTSAIDSLLPSRRSEGIGYYGLSNNVAMATAPSVALYVYHLTDDFNILFSMSLCVAFIGLIIVSSTENKRRTEQKQEVVEAKAKSKISLDRFLLLAGIPEAIVVVALSFSFGVLSTYVAIYSKQELGMSDSSGTFFLLLAGGLTLSRLIGGITLRRGLVVENAQWGMTLSFIGYLLFPFASDEAMYFASAVIIGLGNGHMFPGMQAIFISLAPHNRRGTANATMLTSWDLGVGLGIVVGGLLAETLGYRAAFVGGAVVNLLGVCYFWLRGRKLAMNIGVKDGEDRE